MDQHRSTSIKLQSPVNIRRESRLYSKGAFHAFVPTNNDEMHLANKVHGETSWQSKVLHCLHLRSVQYVLMGLLLLDVMVLFFDLFLLAQYPNCSIIERDAISCCPSDGEVSQQDGAQRARWRFLSNAATGNGAEAEICGAPSEIGSYPAGCDPEKYPRVHEAEDAFFIITITILSIFLLENIVQIVVLSPQVYFRHLFYVLDFFIITVSIGLEVTFRVQNEEALQSLVGLLVVGRVWRFVRISHGLIEVTSELNAQRFHSLLEYTKELEALLTEKGVPIPNNESIQRLRESTH
jgi:hypothetical protein